MTSANESLTIRRGGLEDAELTGGLWERAHAMRGRPLAPEYRTSSAMPVLKSRIVEDDGMLFIAQVGQRQAGMVLGCQARDNDENRALIPQLLHISWVAVDPSFGGRNIARTLLEHLFDYATQSGYRRAQLWTYQNNERARNLYEGLGFTASGRQMTDSLGATLLHYERDL